MNTRTMTRIQRIREIEHLLASSIEGISRVELARKLGVNKSTITRDIQEFAKKISIVEDGKGLLSLHKRNFKSLVELTLFEMEALHLSARLFARVMRLPFPHASSALRKIAYAQQKVSPILSDRIHTTAEEIDSLNLLTDRDSQGYRLLVEELGVAISESRPVSFGYTVSGTGELKQYRVLPLTLEPHFEGRSVHLLASMGVSSTEIETSNSIFRSFNLEFIRTLKTEDPNPNQISPRVLKELHERLFHSWSIWSTDGEPVQVRLGFSGDAAKRVSQTLWHPSQEIEQNDDGRVLWSAVIAEPDEMYQWIRGWGPDVEVIEPQWLRLRHREDFMKGINLYKDFDPPNTP